MIKILRGAAIGVVGVANYIRAGIQDVISGYIIKSNKITLNGLEAYDFSNLSIFWFGSAILSFILCLFIWNV